MQNIYLKEQVKILALGSMMIKSDMAKTHYDMMANDKQIKSINHHGYVISSEETKRRFNLQKRRERATNAFSKHQAALAKHRFKSRATQLAYAFVRGIPYRVAESACKTPLSLRLISDVLDIVADNISREVYHFEIVNWAEKDTWPFADNKETIAAE